MSDSGGHVDGFPSHPGSQALSRHLRALTIMITIIFITFPLPFVLARGILLILSIRSRHRFFFPSHLLPLPSFPPPKRVSRTLDGAPRPLTV